MIMAASGNVDQWFKLTVWFSEKYIKVVTIYKTDVSVR